MDLSSKTDLTAITYYFPEYNYFFIHYYAPGTKIKGVNRIDGVDYREWSANGHITITPGNVIDYDYIVNDILNNAEQFNIILLAYDPYNSDLIVPIFEDKGMECGSIRQGYLSLSPPTKRLEVEVIKKTLRHDGDPVTRWMMGNIEISMDAAGNIKMDKSKSSNKIDGPVSLVTSLAGWMHLELNQMKKTTLQDVIDLMG
jgi:phage terminase large subunit-like protein